MSVIIINGKRYELIDPQLVIPLFEIYYKAFIEYDKKGYAQKKFDPKIAKDLMGRGGKHIPRIIENHSAYGYQVRKPILENPNHLGRFPEQGEPTDFDLSQLPKEFPEDLEEVRQLNLFGLQGQLESEKELNLKLITNLYVKIMGYYGMGLVNAGYLLYPYAPDAVPIITFSVQYKYSLSQRLAGRPGPKIIIPKMAEDGSKSIEALESIRDCLPQEYQFLKLLRIFQVLISTEATHKDTILKPLDSE